MPENLPDHAHCLQCDNAIALGQEFCSEACKQTHFDKVRKENRRNLIFIVIVVVVFVIIGAMSVLSF